MFEHNPNQSSVGLLLTDWHPKTLYKFVTNPQRIIWNNPITILYSVKHQSRQAYNRAKCTNRKTKSWNSTIFSIGIAGICIIISLVANSFFVTTMHRTKYYIQEKPCYFKVIAFGSSRVKGRVLVYILDRQGMEFQCQSCKQHQVSISLDSRLWNIERQHENGVMWLS